MRYAIIVVAILTSGCAFTLGRVQPQGGKTADQQQLDTLVCKDQARVADSGPGVAATGFLLGLTIVGTPLAFSMDRNIQRQEFQKCMAIKGYAVAKDY
ncbi:MAG TPA: hypothetical protein VGG49_02435 [Steroidobacteraceae bacterium]|jgi:hypothetical protein